jgi:hypothetical protein
MVWVGTAGRGSWGVGVSVAGGAIGAPAQATKRETTRKSNKVRKEGITKSSFNKVAWSLSRII